MTIRNYKRGNALYAFDCVIYGHIEMTWREWLDASRYLLRAKCLSYKDDIIRTDKYLETSKKWTWRNVRVNATERLFKHYNLPRYKRQNYAIKIATGH